MRDAPGKNQKSEEETDYSFESSFRVVCCKVLAHREAETPT